MDSHFLEWHVRISTELLKADEESIKRMSETNIIVRRKVLRINFK